MRDYSDGEQDKLKLTIASQPKLKGRRRRARWRENFLISSELALTSCDRYTGAQVCAVNCSPWL